MSGRKTLSWSALSKTFKNSYVRTAILILVVFGGVFAFWFGLRWWSRTQYPLLAVVSTSMVPTLDVGDLIVVRGIDASTLRVGPEFEGEIIVFQSPNNRDDFIVHRAIEKTFRDGIWYFRTQGDNNGDYDPWTGPDTWNHMVSQNLVVGRVVNVVPWFGNLSLFIRTPEGLLLIIALIIIIIIIDLAEYVPSMIKKTLAGNSKD